MQEKTQLNTPNQEPIPTENRIDRIINDISILKQDLVFGFMTENIKYPSSFKNEEIPILNYWLVYLQDLKEKIKIKKDTSKVVIKLTNY